MSSQNIPTKIGEANTGDNSSSESSSSSSSTSSSSSPSPSPSSSPAPSTKIVYVEPIPEKSSCLVATKAWRIYVKAIVALIIFIILAIITYYIFGVNALFVMAIPIIICFIIVNISNIVAFWSSIWFSFTESPCK